MSVNFTTPKDPDDTDDFTLDWVNVLNGETISTFAAAVIAGGVTVGSTSNTTTTTTARVSAGTHGTEAQVRYRITTSGGRQLDRTAVIPVHTQ